MLRTRVLMGTVLAAAMLGALVLDRSLAPWFPFLFVIATAAVLIACHEVLGLLPAPGARPWVCYIGVLALVLANWPAHLGAGGDPWHWVVGAFVGVFALIFVVEAAAFREPGAAVFRISLALLTVSYVGLLTCFLIQLPWLPDGRGTPALVLAIFVPKCGDIGAYFTGRFLGRHRMTPILSPKKTWEGAAGGLAASLLVALGMNAASPVLTSGTSLLSWPAAVGFGLTVGAAGIVGDLMESLIKRDSAHKDASAAIPGFGGLLDVLDSVVFSAPLSYLWLMNGP